MSQAPNIDGVLIQWGDRLFYRSNRVVKVKPQPKLTGGAARQRATAIRQRIEATVVRGAPQVMVKVTGGGRGMKAIAAHFRYISKNGRHDIENERGEKMRGKETLHELADDWRFGGTLIEDIGDRREAFNIMLSMPRGTDPASVQWAAREVARAELADHKYVMVLHESTSAIAASRQPPAASRRQQAVQDLVADHRSQYRDVRGRVEQPCQPQQRLQQVGREFAGEDATLRRAAGRSATQLHLQRQRHDVLHVEVQPQRPGAVTRARH